MKYLGKYKTGKRFRKSIPQKNNGSAEVGNISQNEYSINIIELMELILELQRKKKFYKSIIGRLFYRGRFELLLIEQELKQLKKGLQLQYSFSI